MICLKAVTILMKLIDWNSDSEAQNAVIDLEKDISCLNAFSNILIMLLKKRFGQLYKISQLRCRRRAVKLYI